MAQADIFLNVTAWAGDWAEWQFSINKAAQIAHGIRMDAMLWYYSPSNILSAQKRGILQRAARDAKARGLKLRIILGYNVNWTKYVGDGMGARPYEEFYDEYVAVMNDVIATVNTAYGTGFRTKVSYEFWNEPSRRTGDGSRSWDAKFFDFVRYAVPKLKMNGTTLWAPTMHGHPEDIEFEIAFHNQMAAMYPNVYRKFGGWNLNVYNSRPTSNAVLDVQFHVDATVARLQHAWDLMQKATNLLAISKRIIISETGVGFWQINTPKQLQLMHDVRVQAIDGIMRKAAYIGFESVGLYKFSDGNVEESKKHYYGLYYVNNTVIPYAPYSDKINWKVIPAPVPIDADSA